MAPRRTTPLRALNRIEAAGALPTLVRGALSPDALQQLLADALPEQARYEMPAEIWSGLASGIAAENDNFAERLAERLQASLALDTEPSDIEEWWPMVRERPLEALWLAALSERRAVRDEFGHMARHCVENFRASAEDSPPSWEFVEAVLGVQARTLARLRDGERRADEAERRAESAQQRTGELRNQLKTLRRENAGLRSALATAEPRSRRRALAPAPESDAGQRVRRMETRLRKLEKEREHLRRRLASSDASEDDGAPKGPEPLSAPATGPRPGPQREHAPGGHANVPGGHANVPGGHALPSIEEDPEPPRRVLRFVLRRLLAKGKIGAAHTHEDNVLRSLPDHEKGLARDVVERLDRAGYLIAKPTASDPHLSLSPDRLREAHEIVEGRAEAGRLARGILGRRIGGHPVPVGRTSP